MEAGKPSIDMKEITLDGLIADLKHAHAANLQSVILYGSSVTGNHVEGVSDHNVLIVLEGISPKDLRAAQPVVEKWHKAGHPLPLYFTREEIRDAADVFPIEFLDMSEHHRVLFGNDVLEDLQVSKANLRHQIEYELRGKLIRLRGLYIPASRSGERLSRLMADSLPNFVTLFRHVLGLMGHPAAYTKREVIEEVSQRLSVDVTAFRQALDLRTGAKDLPLEEAELTFAGYLAAVEQVIEKVDSAQSERG